MFRSWDVYLARDVFRSYRTRMFPGKKTFTDVVDVAIDGADEKLLEHRVALENAMDRGALLVAGGLLAVAVALLAVAVARL